MLGVHIVPPGYTLDTHITSFPHTLPHTADRKPELHFTDKRLLLYWLGMVRACLQAETSQQDAKKATNIAAPCVSCKM
jgi:hypothetical protein